MRNTGLKGQGDHLLGLVLVTSLGVQQRLSVLAIDVGRKALHLQCIQTASPLEFPISSLTKKNKVVIS